MAGMSMMEIHRLYCQRFMDQFEAAQQNLLKKNQSGAAHEFELLFDCFKCECWKNLVRLKTGKENKEQYRLFKQLDLICRQFNQLIPPLEYLKNNDYSSGQVIKYFEDQHRFKKTLNNHLQDLNTFLDSSLN